MVAAILPIRLIAVKKEENLMSSKALSKRQRELHPRKVSKIEKLGAWWVRLAGSKVEPKVRVS